MDFSIVEFYVIQTFLAFKCQRDISMGQLKGQSCAFGLILSFKKYPASNTQIHLFLLRLESDTFSNGKDHIFRATFVAHS